MQSLINYEHALGHSIWNDQENNCLTLSLGLAVFRVSGSIHRLGSIRDVWSIGLAVTRCTLSSDGSCFKERDIQDWKLIQEAASRSQADVIFNCWNPNNAPDMWHMCVLLPSGIIYDCAEKTALHKDEWYKRNAPLKFSAANSIKEKPRPQRRQKKHKNC